MMASAAGTFAVAGEPTAPFDGTFVGCANGERAHSLHAAIIRNSTLLPLQAQWTGPFR